METILGFAMETIPDRHIYLWVHYIENLGQAPPLRAAHRAYISVLDLVLGIEWFYISFVSTHSFSCFIEGIQNIELFCLRTKLNDLLFPTAML